MKVAVFRKCDAAGLVPTCDCCALSISSLATPVHRERGTAEVLTTLEAANYLGVSKQLLELLRLKGGGPRYAKLSRLVRYRRSALDEWLIEHERVSTSTGPHSRK
jgi:excisionase family DNA binding protein